jgi:nucleoside-diphosphate-sugar epimerase
MERLVVTGALGHIGSRFIHSLRPGEFGEVVLLDNLSTQRYCSLFNLPAGVKFRFFEEDVCSCDLARYFSGADAVIHLAAVANAEGSFDVQEQVERVNFEGTVRVAKAAAVNGSRLIYLSTTSVYGTQEEVVDESCPAENLKPQSPYAASKLRAEDTLASLAKSDGLKHVTCRFGTIYGTSIGMRFHTAVNKFVWQACLGQPMTVWRTALHQKRPYLDLGDAVRALKFILQSRRFDNEIYNVLTENRTVSDIVETIRRWVPDLQVKFVDSRIMNQLSYNVLNDKFRALGFRFEGALPKAIEETVSMLRGARTWPQLAGAKANSALTS